MVATTFIERLATPSQSAADSERPSKRRKIVTLKVPNILADSSNVPQILGSIQAFETTIARLRREKTEANAMIGRLEERVEQLEEEGDQAEHRKAQLERACDFHRGVAERVKASVTTNEELKRDIETLKRDQERIQRREA